ncbi:MAG: SMC-Scp complex subunit ScpB [Bosea sp. (in: a-proteobacteria)]
MSALAENFDDDAGNATALMPEALRVAEALLFASPGPVSENELSNYLPGNIKPADVMARLEQMYALRGVNLVRIAGKWAFRTAEDLGHLLVRRVEEPRRLTRAALETLAIIAYHQPVTRAEIEEIRGVATSKGTLDTLLESSWIRLRGRRRTPGRPLTYGTTAAFLEQFGLDRVDDLPGLDDLKGAGFLEGRLPKGLDVPLPSDDTALRDDEDPLDDLFAPLDGVGPDGEPG